MGIGIQSKRCALALAGWMTVVSPPVQAEAADAASVRREVASVLDSLTRALATGDEADIQRHFSIPHFVGAIQSHEGVPDLGILKRTALSFSLRRIFLRHLNVGDEQPSWEQLALKRIETASDPERAIAWSRERDADGIGTSTRWWLVRREGRWMVYDYEDLDVGYRLSMLLAARVAGGLDGNSALCANADALDEAIEALHDENTEQLRAALDRLSEPLPGPFEALRWTLETVCGVAMDDWEAGLAASDRADAIRQEIPLVSYMRGMCLVELKRYREAIEAVDRYEEFLGPDHDSHHLRGRALTGMDRQAEAEKVFLLGLEDYSDSVDNLIGLARVLPAERKEEFVPYFEKFREPGEWFETIAVDFYEEDEAEELEILVGAYRALAPQDPDVAYYDAMAKFIREEYAKAATVLDAAIPTIDDGDDQKPYFVEAFLDAMYYDGKPLQGYARAPAPESSFTYVADLLHEGGHFETIEKLIAEHRKKRPDDPQQWYWVLDVHWHREEYELALKTFHEHRKVLVTMKDRIQDVESIVIFSGIRVKRLEGLLELAQASTKRDGDPYWEFVVQAARGDAKAALKALTVCVDGLGYAIESIYDDDDLEPLLMSEALTELRKAFPPPSKELEKLPEA